MILRVFQIQVEHFQLYSSSKKLNFRSSTKRLVEHGGTLFSLAIYRVFDQTYFMFHLFHQKRKIFFFKTVTRELQNNFLENTLFSKTPAAKKIRRKMLLARNIFKTP